MNPSSHLSSRIYGWFPQGNTVVLHDFGVKFLYSLYVLYKETEQGEEKRKKEKRKQAKKDVTNRKAFQFFKAFFPLCNA